MCVNKLHTFVFIINVGFMNEKLKIFICAHSEIECEIPKDNRYVILSQLKEIDSHGHELIVIDDEFTQNHNVCYGEGCQMRWLWKHQEILPDYVGFCHYRRYFDEFDNNLDDVIPLIDKCGAVVMSRWYLRPFGSTNKDVIINRHIKSKGKSLINIVGKSLNLEYKKAFEVMLDEDHYNTCNLFIMKREDFIEMCDIIFSILDEFDRVNSFSNNKDVRISVLKSYIIDDLNKAADISWHNRLQGFLLEWLTSAFYKYKFGSIVYETECLTRGRLIYNDITTEQLDDTDWLNTEKKKLKRKVVYVFVGDSITMKKQLDLSLLSLKQFNDCNVTILTDTETQFNDFIYSNATIKRIKIKNDNVKYRSRFLKTQIARYIDGSWLFLDVDTIIMGCLSDLDCFNGLYIAHDGNNPHDNLKNIQFRFKCWDTPVYGHYYNSGVIVGDDSSKKFFRAWHSNWIDYHNQTSYLFDQQSLSKTNKDFGFTIKPLESIYNWQIVKSHKANKNVKIIHYWGNIKFNTPERRFIDQIIMNGNFTTNTLIRLNKKLIKE